MSFWTSQDTFQRRKYLHYFTCLDANCNGVLDWGDFRARALELCSLLGLPLDGPEAKAMLEAEHGFWSAMRELIGEGDVTVTRDAFIGFYIDLADKLARGGEVPSWMTEPLRSMLHTVDHNNDGMIELDEFTLYIWALDSGADTSDAFSRLDLNNDGKIDLSEFEALYAEWITTDDPTKPGNYLMTGRLPPGQTED